MIKKILNQTVKNGKKPYLYTKYADGMIRGEPISKKEFKKLRKDKNDDSRDVRGF